MAVPLLLLFLATLASAVAAYGMHPVWAQYPRGLELIMLARQLQWPLLTASVALCLALVALVVAGKRRAWWLIGLGPVLALFVHRFYSDPLRSFAIPDGAHFVAAERAEFLRDEDHVVGLVLSGSAYAYPYAVLYGAPVIIHADHDTRIVLIWSAFANRAVAYEIGREVRGRDLEIVSMPADSLLLYNRKLGEFVVGVTGRMPNGKVPSGFRDSIAVEKETWGRWRAEHPTTRVLTMPDGADTGPGVPLRPWFAGRGADERWPGEMRIVLIGAGDGLAIPPEQVSAVPLNVSAGQVPVVLFRDEATGRVRAFERRIDDLAPKFEPASGVRAKGVFMVDEDTGSGWSADGRALDGPLGRSGRQLKPIAAEEDLYWGVMKAWMRGLRMVALDKEK